MQDRPAVRTAPLAAIPRRAGAALVAALALGAHPAHAYLDNYLSNTIVGSMTPAEARAFSQAAGKALADTADGEAMDWTAPAQGNREPVRANIRALESKTDQGQPCRRMRTELRRGTSEEHWTGWFCKQSDGQWKSRKVGG
jgi:surface antigen